MKRACLFFTWMSVIYFTYCGTASADEALKPFVLEKSGPERRLPERLLGASAEALIEHLIDDPHKVAALEEMDLAFVRFPGGSQANYYDWRTGLLDMPVTPRSSPYMRFWSEIAPKIRAAFPQGVKIGEYTKFARQGRRGSRAGAEPGDVEHRRAGRVVPPDADCRDRAPLHRVRQRVLDRHGFRSGRARGAGRTSPPRCGS